MSKKVLSLLIAFSVLIIPFSLHVIAVSTECQYCHSSNIRYDSLGDVGDFDEPNFHHEIYCYNCSSVTGEEQCDFCFPNNNCTNGGRCVCGCIYIDNSHTFGYELFNEDMHLSYCKIQGCDGFVLETHTFNSGSCIYCGYCEN